MKRRPHSHTRGTARRALAPRRRAAFELSEITERAGSVGSGSWVRTNVARSRDSRPTA